MDSLQSSAMDTLDSSLQSLDSPTVASMESMLNSPSGVGSFFSEPSSANYIQPNNLFGLHEPHFRVLLREIGLKLPGRKARKTFERAAEGPTLTRATFLHALVRLALRASKKRPHQAIAKLVGRVARTPAAADDGHRAKLFYCRDTERAFGAHIKELQRLFVVYSASDDDATRVIAHVNGRLPLEKWLAFMADGDVLQTTYMELTPQILHLAFFRARPLSKVPEQALAFVDFLEALSRVAAACAELPGACDFSHPLKIEDVLETQRAEKRREAAEQARQAILAEQEAAKPKKKGKKVGSSVKNALGVDLAALREAPSVSITEEDVDVPVDPAAVRRAHAAKLDWLLRHVIARVALKRNGVLDGGGKPLALVPKYLSKKQLTDPKSTRTSLDYPLWCAEQDVAAQDPDADGAVEETGDM